MTIRIRKLFVALSLLVLLLAARAAVPVSRSFTYQGHLKHDGAPANGDFEMAFRLFDAPTLGNQVGDPVVFDDVAVTSGLFTVALNATGEFGEGAFNGEQRWLQITVDGMTLTPRQELTPSAYSLRASEGVGGPNALNVTASGEVGIGTTTPTAPLDVSGAARVTTLEITGGSPLPSPLAGWGNNTFGQVDVPFETFTGVAAGGYHSLAIREDGTLAAWGQNNAGQTSVPPGTFTAVSASELHSLAIRTDGTLAGWGRNVEGQTTVPPGTFSHVAAGQLFSLAIDSNGTLAGWGANDAGQTTVPPGTFIAVAAGNYHGLAIRTNGTLAGWGESKDGQTDVPKGTFIAVAAGNFYSLGIRSDGTLVGWGADFNGQLDTPDGIFTAVAAGDYHGLAIRDDGTLAAWGYNADGQTDVPSGVFTAVAAGAHHSLAIRGDTGGPAALVLHNDSAYKPGTDRWTISSDRRLKKNIEPLSGALDRLLQLRGVTFQWIDPASQGGITGTQTGLIADEVQRAFPQWIGRDAKGYQTLTVGGFEAVTAEAVRELRAEKDAEIAALRFQVAESQARLAALEAVIARSCPVP